MKLFALLAAASDASVRMDACAAIGKPSFCATITPKITRTNAWTCKDCFNLRIEVNLNQLGAVGALWDNQDHVFLTFDNDVSFVKAAGPAASPAVEMAGTDEGYQMWRVDFQNTFNPGDRRIDINVGKLSEIFIQREPFLQQKRAIFIKNSIFLHVFRIQRSR